MDDKSVVGVWCVGGIRVVDGDAFGAKKKGVIRFTCAGGTTNENNSRLGQRRRFRYPSSARSSSPLARSALRARLVAVAGICSAGGRCAVDEPGGREEAPFPGKRKVNSHRDAALPGSHWRRQFRSLSPFRRPLTRSFVVRPGAGNVARSKGSPSCRR